MNRKFNFGAGPATLPLPVLEEVQEEILDWKGLGVSVLEISHRSNDFQEMALQATQDFIDLLSIPDNYCVVFLHGGASLQMSMIPLNFSKRNEVVSYVNSGYWAKKAIDEAENYNKVEISASSEESNFNYFPTQNLWKINSKSNYIHVTPNETIGGVALRSFDKMTIPLIADYSSSILSEPLEVSKFGVIYGGAQKNIGPAGLGFAIIRKDLLEGIKESVPTMLNYSTHQENNSMYNTPPTFAWYVAGKVFRWLKSLGGLKEISKTNLNKATKLYKFIDQSDLYFNNIEESSRSIMNIPFLLRQESLNSKFLDQSTKSDLFALKGHRSVGGMRASIYNAMPEEGIDRLIEFMKAFEKDNL